MKKLAIAALALMMVFGSTAVAVSQDSEQQETVRAIQHRVYQKSHELGIAAGYIPDDDFYEAFPVGGYYMFTFNEHIAWEVARAQWIFTTEKDLKSDLENDFGVRPSDLPLSCPMPGMYLWNSHPKVFIPIAETGIFCSASVSPILTVKTILTIHLPKPPPRSVLGLVRSFLLGKAPP